MGGQDPRSRSPGTDGKRRQNRRSRSSNRLMDMVAEPEKSQRRGRSSSINGRLMEQAASKSRSKSRRRRSPSRPRDGNRSRSKSVRRTVKQIPDMEEEKPARMKRSNSVNRRLGGDGYTSTDEGEDPRASRPAATDPRRANRRRTTMAHSQPLEDQPLQKQRSRRRLSCFGAAAVPATTTAPLSKEMERRRSARRLDMASAQQKERDQARIFDQALSKRSGHSRSTHHSFDEEEHAEDDLRHPSSTAPRRKQKKKRRPSKRNPRPEQEEESDYYSSDDDVDSQADLGDSYHSDHFQASDGDITIDTIISLEEEETSTKKQSKSGHARIRRVVSSNGADHSVIMRGKTPIRRSQTFEDRRVAAASIGDSSSTNNHLGNSSNNNNNNNNNSTTKSRPGLYCKGDDTDLFSSKTSLAILKLGQNLAASSISGGGGMDDQSQVTATTTSTSTSSGSTVGQTARKMKDLSHAFRSSQGQMVPTVTKL